MLETLIEVSRSRPTQRRLMCPDCGADVELRGGLLRCTWAPLKRNPTEEHGQSVWLHLRDLAVDDPSDPDVCF